MNHDQRARLLSHTHNEETIAICEEIGQRMLPNDPIGTKMIDVIITCARANFYMIDSRKLLYDRLAPIFATAKVEECDTEDLAITIIRDRGCVGGPARPRWSFDEALAISPWKPSRDVQRLLRVEWDKGGPYKERAAAKAFFLHWKM